MRCYCRSRVFYVNAINCLLEYLREFHGVEALHGLDLGDLQGLTVYQRDRRAETARFTALTTGLHDVMDRGPAPVRALAATGLQLIDRLGPVKALLRGEANR